MGNFCAQQLVMAGIPREDLIGARLDGASRDQCVVDRPTGDPVGGGLPDAGEISLALKTHEAEAAVDAFEKFDCLVRRSPMWQRESRERGIDFSKTMRCTARDIAVALCIQPETCRVVRMFSQKNRDQNGRIEKDPQLESPRIARSRSRRTRSSVSSVTEIPIG